MIAALLLACNTPHVGSAVPPTPTAPGGSDPPLTAHVSLVAWPADAHIVAVRASDATALEGKGTLDAELPPGPVSVAIDRPGFAPATLTLDLHAGERVTREVKLVGNPVHVAVSAHPDGATVTIASGGTAVSGPAPFSADVPAGDVVVTVAAPGLRTEETRAFLDGAATYDVWLDPEGAFLDLLRVFPTGKLPKGAAITPDNREVWVTALGGPPAAAVYVHDLHTGAELAAIDLPPMRAGQVGEGSHGAVEVALTDHGAHAYVTQMESYRVFEIDTATRTVTRLVEKVRRYPKIIIPSPDESKLYVSLWELDSVKEIDRATLKITRDIPTVHTPRGLYVTPDDEALYVAGFGDGKLAKIDLATGTSTVVWCCGKSLRHLAGDGTTMYVSDMGTSRIYAYDLPSGTMREFAHTEPIPNTIDLSPDGRLLFVSSRGPNGPGGYLTESGVPGSVEVFDTATGERVDKAVAGSQPTALDVSPDGRYLVVSDFRDDALRVYAIPPYRPTP